MPFRLFGCLSVCSCRPSAVQPDGRTLVSTVRKYRLYSFCLKWQWCCRNGDVLYFCFLNSRLGNLCFASKWQDASLGFMLRLKSVLPQSARRRIFMFVGTWQGVYRVTRYLSGYSRKPCPDGEQSPLRSRAIRRMIGKQNILTTAYCWFNCNQRTHDLMYRINHSP